MADRKYGQLYSVDDVKLLVAVACRIDDPDDVDVTMLAAKVEGEGFPLTFPADEPLFLLRGKDKAVSDAIHFYGDRCEALGADENHLHIVVQTADEMAAWQRNNPDRVKVPDTDEQND